MSGDGGYVDATSGRTFETLDPASGECLARVQHASSADIDRAVQAATDGQCASWTSKRAARRCHCRSRR
ncbi:aldehyde dehydrogenase family protein [Burkholderia lata]|uniref:aldehyde dehydrogenase family protein n=1 Tax=Burkholderia lata (strain ATCC 17760 / DSM 23089 / LMG 22485 / NCIMB 9086 / R18194 / 383) TaxID=482957 RepID=UPI003999F23A